MFENHLSLTLDLRLNFLEPLRNITQKIRTNMDQLLRLQPILLGLFLLTIYWAFTRSQTMVMLSITKLIIEGATAGVF